MSHVPPPQTEPLSPTVRPTDTRIRVWDRFVRLFHWSLVASFALSYWAAKAGWHELHTMVGYFVSGLIVARLYWGIFGSRHARFSDFVHSPAAVLHYVKTIALGHPRRYLGHNPAGGLMVVALLAVLAVISLTGLTYAVREAHAVAVNVILAMLSLHLLGVFLASFQHKESLVRAMITGDKDASIEAGTPPVAQPKTKDLQLPAYSTAAEKN